MARDLQGAVGVLGGTFDPVHVGHLSIAQQVRRELSLEKVILLPAGEPPHKDATRLAPAADRLTMTELAARNMLGLEVCGYEVERPGISYTIDTLRWLRDVLERPLVFIIGADTLNELASWRSAKELVDEFAFAIAARPGYTAELPSALEKKIGRDLSAKLRESVVNVEPAAVSSTAVRERLASGDSVGGMVRAPVELYIHTHGLYGTTKRPGGLR